MSNQLQITGGAKVRNLEGVLTGTSGVVSSLGINVPSGIPQLDGSGKILVSQLPNSVMEYKGTWNAATNTPTLANGTGNQGDVYLCNVAGTVNFGAGPISFNVGDQVIYSGTIWQRASGATGTVTSVALTETGDALTITGSPITTSGTINIGFAGTTGQYINGAGNLTTFPSFVSSVGLTTTSPALTITNSPITSSGNIGLNFAGTGSQYIKGDGTLATFPTTIDQAKRLITEVYNSTGATLTKGTVVYINGGQGNLPTVTKAQANSDATSAQTYGVVQSDITNMNNGFVVVFGSITDIDTQAYAVGTQLYLSGTTAGEWTSTKPSAPIHLVYVGIVVRSHPTQGVVEIRIQNGYELEELHDVAISAPVNNQGIFYNSSNDLWENKSIATALGYTPANDSLVVHLAGTETITGAKTFNALLKAVQINIDNSTLSEATPLSFKQYSSGTLGSTGFTSLSAIGANQFNINFGGTKTAIFDATNLTANRTYNFPDASGTIALTSDIPDLSGYVTLATSQTISGAKTFSNNVRIDNGSASAFLAFKQYSSGSTGTAGFTSIYAINTDTFGISYGAGNDILFKTASPTLPRTYTFPDASGTVALTSNLTGYVQGSGTTNYIPKFTASGTIGNSSIIDNGTITAYTNAFYVYQTAGTGAAFYMTGGGTDATISSVTSGGANQNLNLMGSTLSLWTGTLGGLAYTERMRITPTGDVGIGNTSPSYKLDVTGTGRFTGALTIGGSVTSASQFIGSNTITDPVAATTTASVLALNGQSAGNNFGIGVGAIRNSAYDMWFQTGATNGGGYRWYIGTTERMTMTNTGNVGIGTGSPFSKLSIGAPGGISSFPAYSTSDQASIGWNYSTSAAEGYTRYMDIAAKGAPDGTYGGSVIRFLTNTITNGSNPVERMRITSGGGFCFNTTVNGIYGSGENFSVNTGTGAIGSGFVGTNSNIVMGIWNKTNGSTNLIQFAAGSNGTGVGTISTNGSTTTYGTTSDYRIKEDFKEVNGLEKVSAIKIYNYKFIESENRMDGVIAHELQEVIPYAVINEKDSFNEDGTIKLQGVDYSLIVPVLVKAIQEQQAIINELSAKVSALENKS